MLGQNLFCRRSTGTLSTTVDYTYVLRYTSLLRARFCSGRRGHFGFFSDGRRAANEFSTTQDSVGAGRVRRLGEVVYQIRRGAFEDETAAAFNHNRRAGRARRRRFGAGRRVHGFDELALSALPELIGSARVSQLYRAVFERGLQLTRTRTRTLPLYGTLLEFSSYRLVLSAVTRSAAVMSRKLSDSQFETSVTLSAFAYRASDGFGQRQPIILAAIFLAAVGLVKSTAGSVHTDGRRARKKHKTFEGLGGLQQSPNCAPVYAAAIH